MNFTSFGSLILLDLNYLATPAGPDQAAAVLNDANLEPDVVISAEGWSENSDTSAILLKLRRLPAVVIDEPKLSTRSGAEHVCDISVVPRLQEKLTLLLIAEAVTIATIRVKLGDTAAPSIRAVAPLILCQFTSQFQLIEHGWLLDD